MDPFQKSEPFSKGSDKKPWELTPPYSPHSHDAEGAADLSSEYEEKASLDQNISQILHIQLGQIRDLGAVQGEVERLRTSEAQLRDTLQAEVADRIATARSEDEQRLLHQLAVLETKLSDQVSRALEANTKGMCLDLEEERRQRLCLTEHLESELAKHKLNTEQLGSELAKHNLKSVEVTSAMQGSQEALESKLASDNGSLEEKLGNLQHDGLVSAFSALEQQIRSELQQISDDHNANHKKMHELIKSVSDEQNVRHTKTEESMADVRKQVDSLTSSILQESSLGTQVEQRLDKACKDLHSDLESAVREARAALQADFLDHSRKGGDMLSSLQKAHEALQGELAIQKKSWQGRLGEHDSLHRSHSSSLAALEQRIQNCMQEVSHSRFEHTDLIDLVNTIKDEQHAKHIRAEEALEQGLQSVRTDIHSKLQEELLAFKSEVDDNHRSLTDTMIDLKAQLDNFTSCLFVESRLTAESEERQKKVCDDLCAEFTDHSKSMGDMVSAMQESHTALQNDFANLAGGIETKFGECNALHAGNALSIAALQQRTFGELQQLSDNHANHCKDSHDMLSSMQEAHEVLNKCCEGLASSLAEETRSRTAVEEQQTKVCHDLRHDLESVMREARETLRTELAEALEALRKEAGMYKASLETKLSECNALHKGNASSIVALEQNIKNELGHLSDDHAKTCRDGRDMMQVLRNCCEALEIEVADLGKSLDEKLRENDEMHKGHASSLMSLEKKICNDLQHVSDEFRTEQVDLKDTMTNVGKQVDSLTLSVNESGLLTRLVSKACDDLRSDLKTDIREASAALHDELIDHIKISGELFSQMHSAQETLQSENVSFRRGVDEKFAEERCLREGHASSLVSLEQKIHNELQSISDEHHAKQVQMKHMMDSVKKENNAKLAKAGTALEETLKSVSKNMQSIQEQLVDLRSDAEVDQIVES